MNFYTLNFGGESVLKIELSDCEVFSGGQNPVSDLISACSNQVVNELPFLYIEGEICDSFQNTGIYRFQYDNITLSVLHCCTRNCKHQGQTIV